MELRTTEIAGQGGCAAEIDEILARIDSLAPVPPIATQILALAENPASSMREIAELIRHDPSTTANILKICNSAYFGLLRKVESIQDALSLLGLDKLIELVLLNCLSGSLGGSQEGYGLNEGQLWRNAVTSAHISVALANKVGGRYNKHRLFTASLLKDIGKLVLSRYVAFAQQQIDTLVASMGYSFNEAEQKVIGISHEALGARIAGRWSFSERMMTIIGNHHLLLDPDAEDFETLIVHMADLICLMMGVGTGADGLAYRFFNPVLEKIGMSEKILEDVMLDTTGLQRQIDELISLV